MSAKFRGRLLFVCAVGMVALGAFAVVMMMWRGDGETATSAGEEQPTTLRSDADDVVEALRRLGTAPETLVAFGARGQVRGHVDRAIPPGTQVRAFPSSWAPDGLGGGVITVTLDPPEAPPTTYSAVMVREDGDWKVLATLPLSQGDVESGGT